MEGSDGGAEMEGRDGRQRWRRDTEGRNEV